MRDESLWTYTHLTAMSGSSTNLFNSGYYLSIGEDYGWAANTTKHGVAYSTYVDVTNFNSLTVSFIWGVYRYNNERNASTVSLQLVNSSGQVLSTIYSNSRSSSTTGMNETSQITTTINVSSIKGNVRLKADFVSYDNWPNKLYLYTCKFTK